MDSIYNHIIKTQVSKADRVLIENVVTNLVKENLIFNKKTPLNEETMPNVIVDKSQDKNEVILDESVIFFHPTPQVHNDIDTPLPTPLYQLKNQNQSTVKIETLITALKSYASCEIQ